ncbi:MAG: hypothetical protein MZU97_15165 [Bacillus subtilis]|nr:hypothetical protein [Bacillus subtilis]
MILRVATTTDLRRFVRFTKTHYAKESFYVQPFFAMLERELKARVLKDRTYTALLERDADDTLRGRLLYTFARDSHRNETACFSPSSKRSTTWRSRTLYFKRWKPI